MAVQDIYSNDEIRVLLPPISALFFALNDMTNNFVIHCKDITVLIIVFYFIKSRVVENVCVQVVTFSHHTTLPSLVLKGLLTVYGLYLYTKETKLPLVLTNLI